MSLSVLDRNYLIQRGYTPSAIEVEGWFSIEKGKQKIEGINIDTIHPMIGVWCTTPVGTKTALQIMNPGIKEYRRFRTLAGNYLPVYFASEWDFKALEATKEVILTEGVFDRIAVKRCLFDQAVFALLGLGVSEKMGRFLVGHCEKIWLMLDRDEKGQQATERIKKTLSNCGMIAESIDYGFKDPGDWLARVGRVRMTAEIEKEKSLKGLSI